MLKTASLLGLTTILVASDRCYGQLDFEKAPILYGQVPSEDAVGQLARRLESGEAILEYDSRLGWLPSILKLLNVDVESQVFVFSKTSLQLHKIHPRGPRAIYFNDDVYVGFCHNGDVLELAATDPRLGAVFYTLDQNNAARRILADRGQCLACHATHRTQGVPGYLVRSVYPDADGRPRSGTRSFVTDHSTEFQKRFGGWYVTGEHGSLRHLGNLIAADRNDPESMDVDSGANKTDLSTLFNVNHYLAPHSDIVALMLLEHQSQMHNLLARASMETRSAIYHDESMNQALGRPTNTVSESTERRIARAAEDVVRYLLFADELALTDRVVGNTQYSARFQDRARQAGQVDSRGRSLRDLDLEQRLFKHPCSYLIYSDAFRHLPPAMYDRIRGRLYEILSSQEPVVGFEHLTVRDRKAILEILGETLPELFAGRTTAS
ncbi:MAG: hypothetical protein KF752_16065 [Pirellulaceae bacterium]|nr:hypothetical protein [Pirellulaceae bacterium]